MQEGRIAEGHGSRTRIQRRTAPEEKIIGACQDFEEAISIRTIEKKMDKPLRENALTITIELF